MEGGIGRTTVRLEPIVVLKLPRQGGCRKGLTEEAPVRCPLSSLGWSTDRHR